MCVGDGLDVESNTGDASGPDEPVSPYGSPLLQITSPMQLSSVPVNPSSLEPSYKKQKVSSPIHQEIHLETAEDNMHGPDGKDPADDRNDEEPGWHRQHAALEKEDHREWYERSAMEDKSCILIGADHELYRLKRKAKKVHCVCSFMCVCLCACVCVCMIGFLSPHATRSCCGPRP